MKRAIGGLVLAVLATPTVAPAQSSLVYLNPGADSVIALRPGFSGAVSLSVYTGCYGLTAYSVTLLFDPSLVQIGTPTGESFPAPTVTPGSGQVTLSASGASGGCTVPVASVPITLDAGATSGTLIDLRLNLLQGYYTGDLLPGAKTDLLEVCTSDKVWGDLDNNGVVNSRDALVTLSKAVGLPVVGFDTTVADVDADQRITSRDALFVLSAGVGLPSGSKAGNGVVDKCARLVAAPSDLVFFSSSGTYGTEVVSGGDTTRSLITTLPFPVDQTTDIRWSPDGSKLAYECYTGATYGYDICLVTPAGAPAPGSLNLSLSTDGFPAWSPDGTQIAYVRGVGSGGASIYLANADGSNQRLVTAAHPYVYSVDWSPDGTRLAYSVQDCCYPRRLYTINVDGTGDAELFTNSASHSPEFASWSPGSDSIAYLNSNDLLIYKAAATGGQPGVPASRLTDGLHHPSWTSAGIAFGRTAGSQGDIYLLRTSDGRHVRLTHGTSANGDKRPDLRRTGQVYISSVSVAPNPATITRSLSTTLQLTATVTNSDASDNPTALRTWTSRNTSVVGVDGTGLLTAGASDGQAYVVVTTGGWRSDSTLVTVQP